MICPLRSAQVEVAEQKKVDAEFILISVNGHRSTVNPIIFLLADQQVLGEKRHRRARPEQAFREHSTSSKSIKKRKLMAKGGVHVILFDFCASLGGQGVSRNDCHEFPFLRDVELVERSLSS